MLKFKLNRKDYKLFGSRIFYTFTCGKLPDSYKNCRDLKTPETDGGQGQTEYLDRQSVMAADNEVLIGFRLETRFVKSSISHVYNYRVCSK